MARKIWDTERKLHEMETAEISPTLEEKFDEMIRGEFKQVYENRMREMSKNRQDRFVHRRASKRSLTR